MKVNQAHHFLGCVIEFGRGLIQTYIEQDLERAEREQQGIEAMWAAHQSDFQGGVHTLIDFL